jgi:hypothetical protein
MAKARKDDGGRALMLDTVYDAFQMKREEQEETGFNQSEIDGMTGFVFVGHFGAVPNPQSLNRAIKRIISSYNAEEAVQAKKERREPIILPDFFATIYDIPFVLACAGMKRT